MRFIVTEGTEQRLLIECERSSISMVIHNEIHEMDPSEGLPYNVSAHIAWGTPTEEDEQGILQVLQGICEQKLELPLNVFRSTKALLGAPISYTYEHRDGCKAAESYPDYGGTLVRLFIPIDHPERLEQMCAEVGTIEKATPKTITVPRQVGIMRLCSRPRRALLNMHVTVTRHEELATVTITFDTWPGSVDVRLQGASVCIHFKLNDAPLLPSDFERVIRVAEIVSDVKLDRLIKTYTERWYTSDGQLSFEDIHEDDFKLTSWTTNEGSFMQFTFDGIDLSQLDDIHRNLIPCVNDDA